MINEDIRHIIEAELQPGEELLWAGKSDWSAVKRKTIYVFTPLFLVLNAFAAYQYYHYQSQEEYNLSSSVFVIIFINSVLFHQAYTALKKAHRKALTSYYAATDKQFVTITKDPGDGYRSVESTDYKSMKRVFKMNIASASSVTIVLHGGIIPNLKNIIIDGLKDADPLVNILKKKISYL